ncbi:hypothetical protein B0H13DRAFT_2384751 [Mycena leptocephala]|nr:hypothetical protein B0H13DRAFT_2384751 [Mycena leptocephala]
MSTSPALPNFLLSIVPPPQTAESYFPPPAANSIKGAKVLPPPPPDAARDAPRPKQDPSIADGDKTFLGMHLDVKIPAWLTFGKNTKKPSELFAVTPMNEDKGNPARMRFGDALGSLLERTPMTNKLRASNTKRNTAAAPPHSAASPCPKGCSARAKEEGAASQAAVNPPPSSSEEEK